jgi:hypothetical protein
LGETAEALFKQKAASFHFLNFIPHPRFEIGLFESVIWQRWDTAGTLPANLGMFIPVIGYNTAAIGFGKENNMLVGVNLKAKASNRIAFYGQFAKAGKNYKGLQVGTRILNIGTEKLDLQLEWNNLGDFLYNNSNIIQTYTHYNQPLGSPVGPGSNEILGIVSYEYRHFRLFAKYNHISLANIYTSNWALNPETTYVNFVDVKGTIEQIDMRLSYVFNRFTQAQFSVGFTKRELKTTDMDVPELTQVIYLSFSTNLFQQYYDF